MWVSSKIVERGIHVTVTSDWHERLGNLAVRLDQAEEIRLAGSL